jgi:hypothetical protein
MKRFVKFLVERWIINVKQRLGVFFLAKDHPAIDVMQEMVKILRLVGEAPLVIENILRFTTAFWFWGDTYR